MSVTTDPRQILPVFLSSTVQTSRNVQADGLSNDCKLHLQAMKYLKTLHTQSEKSLIKLKKSKESLYMNCNPTLTFELKVQWQQHGEQLRPYSERCEIEF